MDNSKNQKKMGLCQSNSQNEDKNLEIRKSKNSCSEDIQCENQRENIECEKPIKILIKKEDITTPITIVLQEIQTLQQQKISLTTFDEMKKVDTQDNILYLAIEHNFHNNELNENDTQYLCEWVKKCQNLVFLRLDLFKKRINNFGIAKLGEAIMQCKKITQLELNYQWNSVTTNGTIEFANSIGQCINIETLNLAISQSINNQSILQLGEGISKLKKLKNLIIDFGEHPTIDIVIRPGFEITQIYDDGFINFFQVIKRCAKLQFIELYFDNMAHPDLEPIQHIIKKYKNLIKLKISFFEQNKYFKRIL